MKYRIGSDDGHGNKVEPIGVNEWCGIIGPLAIGDIIQISNKEGCIIATYKVK